MFEVRLKKQVLSDEQRENMRNYVYKGGDNSYIYKYLLKPLGTSMYHPSGMRLTNLPNLPNRLSLPLFMNFLFSNNSGLCGRMSAQDSGPEYSDPRWSPLLLPRKHPDSDIQPIFIT